MKERFKNRERIFEVKFNREVWDRFMLKTIYYLIATVSVVALILFIASIIAMAEAGTITRAIIVTFLCALWFVGLYFLYVIFFYGNYNDDDYNGNNY